MESTRQQKVAKQIQRDVSDILLKEGAALVKGSMVSVTTVRVSPDLSFAKVFLSVFPYEHHGKVMSEMEANAWMIRKALGTRVKHQLRHVPEIAFALDDSLEYLENIDNLLKE